MALASIMLRRASSSLLPRSSLLAAASAARSAVHRSVVPLSRFSTSSAEADAVPSRQIANEDLIRMLDVEIKRTNEDLLRNNTPPPVEFPFKIKDTESEDTVVLSRRYEDETIKVEVDMKEEEEDKKKKDSMIVKMVVTVTKDSGNGELLFKIKGYDGYITIDSLFVKKDLWGSVDGQPPVLFNDLNFKLKEGFYKYLETRGMDKTTINFLLEMKKKKMAPPEDDNTDKIDYEDWLCNLRKFLSY